MTDWRRLIEPERNENWRKEMEDSIAFQKYENELYKNHIKDNAESFIDDVDFNVTPEKTELIFKNILNPFLDKMIEKWGLNKEFNMIKADKYFKENLSKIASDGLMDVNPRPKYLDGTPAHTRFITQVFEEYDLTKGEFPIPTLRNTAIKTGIKEILWIYQKQSNNLNDAERLGINWWNEWDIGDRTIGQRYGATVLRYDLIDRLLDGLENDPFGRRHIMNLYQQHDLDETKGLYPCAYETLWSVRQDSDDVYYVDMTLIQRSQDYLMAAAINKIQYVALMMMIVGHLNYSGKGRYKIGKFCHYVHNLHIYDRHYSAMGELMLKEPLDIQPRLFLKESKDFYKYTIDDFIITGTEDITKIVSPLEIAI